MSSGPEAVFDALYTASPDPWNFAGSAYEHAKYEATLRVLGGRRFARGLEAGCSIGVLTSQLGDICDALLALDVSNIALARARARCAAQPGISFRQAVIPRDWPEGPFDLLVFSEILYFLSAADVRATAALARAACRGLILLVNYTGPNEQPLDGDAAATLFIGTSRLRHLHHDRAAGYRLDLLGL